MSDKIVTPHAEFEWTEDYDSAQKGDTVEVVKIYEKDGVEVADVDNYRDEAEVVPVKKIREKFDRGLLKKLN
jgi:hypothetical protein